MRSYIYDGQVTHYQIDENGNLYNKLTKKYLKGWISKAGYRVYAMKINGTRKDFYAHRLVAETYIPNPDNKECVNHIDGNKLNNNINNLEWATKKENNNHALKTGLNNLYKKVYCYDKNKNLVCVYESVQTASKMSGFSENSISNCAKSEKKTLTCGYYWNFIESNDFEIIPVDKRHKKPVGRYDMDGTLLETYNSITEASQLSHFPRVRISDCARGKIKTYGGFIWKFL